MIEIIILGLLIGILITLYFIGKKNLEKKIC